MGQRGFEFPRDDSGQWDGFNEPGIEHFSGNPFGHLGREVTQNTLDARLSKAEPARLLVRRLDVPVKSIPDSAGLKGVIAKCSAGAKEEGQKAENFFKKAVTLFEQKNVSLLQFSDSNTTGVVGPCENGHPYFALMKATGQSKKGSATATGSFGIGKFAPYVVSALRTVFLSTAFHNDGKVHHYVQGKSILMSHDDGNIRRRGTGYWGERKKCLPIIDDVTGLPHWLIRPMQGDVPEVGTTLNILGFVAPKDWQKILGATIAESFFGAISTGHLEVDIEGGPTLSSTTLSSFFADDTVAPALSAQGGDPEGFVNGGHYLSALTSSESIVESHQNVHLGHCRLHILVGENLPKRVAVLRNGMLITDELNRLRRFGDFKEFVAVVECLSDGGNSLLRAMEPPAHDTFEPARLPAEQQKAGRVALDELAKWVREKLKQHAQDPVSEVTSIDELADFFGDDDDGNAGAKSSEEDPAGKLNVRARPLKRKGVTVTSHEGHSLGSLGETEESGEGDSEGDGQGGDGESGSGGSNQSSGGSTAGVGGGASKGGGAPALSLRNVRAVVINPTRRKIAFTPAITGEITVELEDSGADTNRMLHCSKASLGTVQAGRITGVLAEAGHRLVIDIELASVFLGTIRVRAHAV